MMLHAKMKGVSSEITGGGYRFPNVPAQMKEASAPFVRYDIKMSKQEMVLCGVMRSNSYGVKAGVSRGHSKPNAGSNIPDKVKG
jgi:hypothetical protein